MSANAFLGLALAIFAFIMSEPAAGAIALYVTVQPKALVWFHRRS